MCAECHGHLNHAIATVSLKLYTIQILFKFQLIVTMTIQFCICLYFTVPVVPSYKVTRSVEVQGL